MGKSSWGLRSIDLVEGVRSDNQTSPARDMAKSFFPVDFLIEITKFTIASIRLRTFGIISIELNSRRNPIQFYSKWTHINSIQFNSTQACRQCSDLSESNVVMAGLLSALHRLIKNQTVIQQQGGENKGPNSRGVKRYKISRSTFGC